MYSVVQTKAPGLATFASLLSFVADLDRVQYVTSGSVGSYSEFFVPSYVCSP